MFSKQLIVVAVAVASVAAQTSSSTSSAAASGPTEVTACHAHGDDEFFCVDEATNDEWEVQSSGFDADNLPESFEGCHMHDEEL